MGDPPNDEPGRGGDDGGSEHDRPAERRKQHDEEQHEDCPYDDLHQVKPVRHYDSSAISSSMSTKSTSLWRRSRHGYAADA